MAIFRRHRDGGKDGAGAPSPAEPKTGDAWTPPSPEAATAERPAPGTAATPPAPPSPATPAASGSSGTPGLAPTQAPGAAAGARPSERDIVERLDGIRGWLGDLDNTVRVRSRIGLVLAAIAIGAAGAAIYLSLDAKNQSASNNDVGTLRKDVSDLKDSVDSNSQDTTALKGSIGAARSQAGAANATASQLQAQVRKLQADVKQLQQAASRVQTTTVPAVPPTTGTGTTTTPSGGGNSGGTGNGNSP